MLRGSSDPALLSRRLGQHDSESGQPHGRRVRESKLLELVVLFMSGAAPPLATSGCRTMPAVSIRGSVLAALDEVHDGPGSLGASSDAAGCLESPTVSCEPWPVDGVRMVDAFAAWLTARASVSPPTFGSRMGASPSGRSTSVHRSKAGVGVVVSDGEVTGMMRGTSELVFADGDGSSS